MTTYTYAWPQIMLELIVERSESMSFGPGVEVFQDIVNASKDQEVKLQCAVKTYSMEGELEWLFEQNSKPIRANRKYDLVMDRNLVMDFHTQFLSMTIRKGHLGVRNYGKNICRTMNFTRGYKEKVLVIQITG
ncbi:hypothetical protein CHS0354_014340 [Potamilus streckersoni]|uniref:Uncharacterized protein n=1 Tax=Potamilus streckersoni TaxID=2493646 RepID=A0AAE0SLU7_9BIVA|nr:hypothetical protein CHS0354_014340 [Potamilus streckersoni]